MRKKIAKLMELPKGATKRFTFKREGVLIDAFVANFNGDIVAYENLCRHLPITLDYGDGEFFSTDNRFFVCQTHGAFYEPKTGLCIAGPCVGASLIPLETELVDDEIFLV